MKRMLKISKFVLHSEFKQELLPQTPLNGFGGHS